MCNGARVNWDDLRYVMTLGRERTLNRAAKVLGVTHTTVGRRLRTIEDRLGVQLFERTPDGFVPTPAGLEVSDAAERVENEVQVVERQVLGRDDRLRGRLRVSTLDILLDGLIGPFAAFTERYPSVELTVTTPNDQVSLLRREADVALRMSSNPGDDLVGRRLGGIAFAPYASTALCDRVGPDASLEDFPWISWDDPRLAEWFEAWLGHNAPGARIAIRLDENFRTLRRVVEAGVGAHFLPCFTAENDPTLQRIGPVDPALVRDVWLLTLPELRTNVRVRAFMDHMEEALRPLAGALAGDGL